MRERAHQRDRSNCAHNPLHFVESSRIFVSLSIGTLATICLSPVGHRTSTLSIVVAAPSPKWRRIDPWPAKLLPPSTNRNCVRPPAVTRTCAPTASLFDLTPVSTSSTQWPAFGIVLRYRNGWPLALATNMSIRPSLSKSAVAMPRPSLIESTPNFGDWSATAWPRSLWNSRFSWYPLRLLLPIGGQLRASERSSPG